MEFYRSNKNDRISVFVSTLGRPAGEGADEVLTANTVDAAREKHVPLVERSGNDVVVTVGEVIHPMTEAHYIMWKRLPIFYGKPFCHAFIEIYTIPLRWGTISQRVYPGRPQSPGRPDNQTSDREP